MINGTKFYFLIAQLKKILDEDNIWDFLSKDEEFNHLVTTLHKKQIKEKKIGFDDVEFGFYSIATEMINPKKKEGEPYNLFDSGDFLNQTFLDFSDSDILIDSLGADKKNNEYEDVDLREKYPRAFGVNDDTLNKIIDETKKILLQYITNKI